MCSAIVADRRKSENRPLELLVDTGLVCRFSLGNEAARLLYLSHNIPSTISARVLYHDDQRRATGLELLMLERRQRINLAPLHDLQGY
jgi:hypothetical protein